MLALTRERLLARLLALREVTDLYAHRDPAFGPGVMAWLEGTEAALAPLRHPLTSLAAAERGRVLAAADGLWDPAVRGERTTPREAERASAAAAALRVEEALRSALQGIETTLGALEEQMCQLVACASAREPIPLQGGRDREGWLRDVWGGLRDGDPKLAQLHRYLATRLTWTDRLYVLGGVLDRLLSGAA
jgi:hypothetical protein